MSRNLVTILAILLAATAIVGIIPTTGICLTPEEIKKIAEEEKIRNSVRQREKCLEECKKYGIGGAADICYKGCYQLYGTTANPKY
jgi:hypothetical protein